MNVKDQIYREVRAASFSISTAQDDDAIICECEGSYLGVGVGIIRALTDICNKDQTLREVLKAGMLGLLDEIKEAEGAND